MNFHFYKSVSQLPYHLLSFTVKSIVAEAVALQLDFEAFTPVCLNLLCPEQHRLINPCPLHIDEMKFHDMTKVN